MTEFVTYTAAIAATDNSTAVVGTGTSFIIDGVRPGDIAYFLEASGPVGYPIEVVASATSLTLSCNYEGSTGSSKSVIIARRYGEEKAADTFRLLNSYVQALEDTISVSQAGIRYVYSSTTTMAAPASGTFRLNNVSAASVTAIAFSDLCGETGNPDASAFINSWDDSSAVTKGILYFKKAGDPSTFMVYAITGLTDNTGWSQLAVSYVTGNGSLVDADAIRIDFYRTGNDGFEAGTRLTYSTTVTDSDPGIGQFRFNNATFASITQIFIDDADVNGNVISALLDLFDDSTTTATRGIVRLQKSGDPTVYRDFTVNGAVVNGAGYRKIPVTPIVSSGTWTNGNSFSLTFFRTGNAGADGFQPGFRYSFSTTLTDADPGAGTFRFNNATHSAATFAYLDNTDLAAATITTWLDSLDDSTQANHKGYFRVQKANDPATYREYVVTGAIVDGTGYRKVPISHIASAGVLSNADTIVVTFSRTGNAGTDGIQPGYRYTFSTTVTDADPGAGTLRANNATFNSITQLFIDNLDAAGATVTSWLDSLDDSTSTVKGTLRIEQLNAPTTYREFQISGGVTDGTGYRKVPVLPIASNGTLSDAASIVITWFRAGDQGTSILSDGDKGDISITGGVWNIDAGVVTNAKRADMASGRISGRISVGSGAPEDLTPAQARSVLSVYEALTASRTYFVRAALPAPTFTAASANVTMTAHGLSANDPVILAIPPTPATCTITAANPAVVTRVAHGYASGRPIQFSSTGYLPTGITAGTTYFVLATGLTADTFQFSATVGGAAINTTAISSSFTNASATITTGSAHGLAIGQLVRLAGTVATNFAVATDYHVVSVPSATQITISATKGGTAIVAGSTVSGGTVVQAGTHYVEAAGAMPTFSTAGLLVAGTVYYVGSVVDANTVTLSTTLGNANPLGTATLATGSPIYAAATGNDNNDGLAASRGGAFLTLQKAADAAAALLLGPNNVGITVADSVYTSGVNIQGPWLGTGTVTITGNTTNPANCSIRVTAGTCVTLNNGAALNMAGFDCRTITSGFCFNVQNKSTLGLNTIFRVGPMPSSAPTSNVSGGGVLQINGAMTVYGVQHVWLQVSDFGSVVLNSSVTHTFIGNWTWGALAVLCTRIGACVGAPTIERGSVLGTRYSSTDNSLIATFGAGASYFPGSVAGSVSNGGLYT
jgi:hypothetical protein